MGLKKWIGIGGGVFLYLAALLDMLLVNNTLVCGIMMIFAAAIGIIICNTVFKAYRNILLPVMVGLTASIVTEILFLTTGVYACFVIAAIVCMICAFCLFFAAKLLLSNDEAGKNRETEKRFTFFRALKKVGRWCVSVIVGLITLIVVVTAITPNALIVTMQTVLFPANNSFDAHAHSEQTVLSNGHLYINDVQYGTEYPNSYLDIYICNNDMETSRPTIVSIHGGAFVWGDKAEGDPYGEANSFVGCVMAMLDGGYNVISINYSVAPDHIYPTPIHQLSQAVEFLQDNAELYALDMSRVIFGGGSAGGHIQGQFLNIQTNPAYAEAMGIEPVIDRENIIAAVFNSALLDNERFCKTGNAILDYLFFHCGRAYFNCNALVGNSVVIQSNVISNVTSAFPPTYISDGNTDTFSDQAKDLHEALTALGVRCELNYHSRSEVILLHGYEADGSVWAKDNMQKELDFLEELLK